MPNKVVVIFVEGETDEEFYNELKQIIRKKHNNSLDAKVIVENAGGIGQYKSKVSRIFEKRIKPQNSDAIFEVCLCYDTDVFELSSKPPINRSEMESMLIKSGANKVHHIKAKKSIEDWFLYDLDGVLSYLKLPLQTHPKGTSGYEKLKFLFRKSDKVYIKGKKTAGFIQSLNIEKIMSIICSELKPLCISLGMKCKKNICTSSKDK